MGFLSPWFLAGFAVVGLPLWLHLLRRFRRTPRPFSSLMFFERRIQSSTKHRRLRYLTLLAMRVALLVLLALAFANPFINQSAAVAHRRLLTVIAIDRSFSMRAGNRIAEARTEAHRIVNSLNESSFAQVTAFDSHLEVLTPARAGKAALNAAIESVEPGDDISSYGELARSLRVLEQTSGMRLDAHVITDAQQTSMPAAFSDVEIGAHISLAIHQVGRKTPNWAVETVNAPARIYSATPVRITAAVAGWQNQPATRRVFLEIDGRTLASKDVTIASDCRTQVEFDPVVIPHGAHRGRVRIEPGDDLPQDDSYAFSIERSDARPVAFLYAAGRAREAFYYKAALDALPDSGLLLQPAPIERVSELDVSRYAYIVLNNPAELENASADKLSRYVANGGSLLIAAGPATAGEHRVPIAGNELSISSEIESAGEVDSQSPAIMGAGAFENVQFVRPARLVAKTGDRILARFTDGLPLLLEQRLGEGRILTFASTLDNTTSDFPLHTSFLPFVARTAAYLSGAEIDPSSVVAGTPIALRNANTQTSAADVIGPDGKHLLTLNESTRTMSYSLMHEGFYEVQRANGYRSLVAVHADRRESNLTPVARETLDIWRNTGASSSGPPEPTAVTGTVRRDFWRFFLTLALLAAFIESWFGMRYLSNEREAV